MKKFLASFFVFVVTGLCVSASDFPDIRYKNIKLKDKICYNTTSNTWSQASCNKDKLTFTKVKGFGDTFDYNDSNKNFAFTTGCEYEFIFNNSLIGYSNNDLKFYEISYANGGIGKRALTKDEISAMLPEYTIISLSEFNKNTNVFKLKKHMGELKILLYNDSNEEYRGYYFSSGNAKIKKYDLNGFLSVHKSGMIEFAPNGAYSNEYPRYVLLVR